MEGIKKLSDIYPTIWLIVSSWIFLQILWRPWKNPYYNPHALSTDIKSTPIFQIHNNNMKFTFAITICFIAFKFISASPLSNTNAGRFDLNIPDMITTSASRFTGDSLSMLVNGGYFQTIKSRRKPVNVRSFRTYLKNSALRMNWVNLDAVLKEINKKSSHSNYSFVLMRFEFESNKSKFQLNLFLTLILVLFWNSWQAW